MFKSRGFTDRLYFLNFVITWVFVFICLILTAISGIAGITDMSVASYGIPAAFAELGVHTGYIVWKAKCENLNKHPVYQEISEESPDTNLNTQVIGFEVDSGECDDYEDS